MIYLHGAGGGGGGESARTPVEDPNSLRSVARARIIDLLCEGEIGGLVNGLRSVYLNDTPLQAADGSYNFKDVGITVHNGTANQPALPNSDGVESEIGVGVKVLQATPVIRTISSADVDSVRVTIGVPTLVQVDTSNGDQHGTDLQYKLSVSCNGAAYVDLPLGSTWNEFTGPATPVSVTAVRGRVMWTPEFEVIPMTNWSPSVAATIGVEVSTNGGASYSRVRTQEVYAEKLSDNNDREFGFFSYELPVSSVAQLRVVFDGVPNGVISLGHLEYQLLSTTITLSGKTTSRYQESYRVNLQALGAAPYSLKLTRITADSASSSLQNELWWDSYTTIIEDKFSYPHSAVVGLEFNSEYFSSLPTRGYEMYLLIVKVPTNYNPITREYSGSWNGSWKMAWTDNPAWCFFDMATNPRYGAGEFIKPDMLDKWAFYEMAQYCDELVPNGFGGLEPRFTCNLYMQTRQEAFRVMQDMASIFRAIQFWGPNGLMVDQDAPETAMYQFTNANVEQGKFNYTSANIKARHNAVLVTWNDPDDMYRQKVEYVDDQELIATWGYLATSEVVAIGCTSRSQARRLGKWLLYTERYEAETISFTTGLEGAIPTPGAVIQVMDAKRAGLRHGGRLLAVAGLTITLDAPVTLVAGTHTITVINADGQPETRTITTAATTTDVLTIDSAWSVAPQPNAVWVLTSPVLEPTFWRVLSVTEKEAGSKYDVMALRHYPGKFAFVEENDPLPPPINTTLPATKQAPPIPAGLVASGYLVVDSAKVERIRITASWQSIAGGLVRGYKVRYRRKGGSWSEIAESSSNSVDFAADDAALYTIEVAAVNVFGISGQWATLDYTPNVTRTIPAAPTVALEQAFVGSSCKIKWAAVDGAVRYKVEVWAASTLRRTVSLGNVLRYDYTSQDATADGGPWRDVTFKVSAINATAVEGPQGTLNANNPAPAALSGLSVTGGWESLFFKCTKPTDQDFANILIYISTTSGFTPDANSLVYQGPANTVTIDRLNNGTLLVGGTSYYLRAAASDLFGSTGLNMSSELTAQPLSAAGAINPGDIVETMLADLAVGPKKLNIDIGGGNLCQNSSFEIDSNADGLADGWGVYNNGGDTTSAGIIAGRRAGTLAQRIAWVTPNTSTKGVYRSAQFLPNKTFVLSWYARATDANVGATMSVAWNLGPVGYVDILNPALTTEWQRYAVRLTWGSSIDNSFYISINGTGHSGALEFDDFQLEQGDVLTGYSESFVDVNTRIDSLSSVVNGNTAAISTEATTRANNDTAIANSVTALTTTVDNNTAAISDEAVARSAVDSALADSINSVSARLNAGGDVKEAIVSAQSTATASLNSVNAKYTLKVQAGNFIAGIALSADSGGGESAVAILCDKFAVAIPSAVPGSPVYYPLIVGNVNGASQVGINGNMVVDGSLLARHIAAQQITTEKIMVGAVTAVSIVENLFHSESVINQSSLYTGWGSTLGITATKTTAPIVLIGLLKVSISGCNAAAYAVVTSYYKLFDATASETFKVTVPIVTLPGSTNGAEVTIPMYFYDNGRGAGTHTFSTAVKVELKQSNGTPYSASFTLNITGRASLQENKV